MKIKVKRAKGVHEGSAIGNNGIDLDVYSNDKDEKGKAVRLGDLRIGKAKLIWCPGKTALKNGKVRTWEQLIAFFDKE